MKMLKHPIVQTALVVVGVLIVLPFLRPLVKNVPLLNQI